jgi:hypothetical protein
MWFAPLEDLAHAYHRNAIRDGARPVTYVVRITGNILSSSEFERVCEELGIDRYEYECFLVSNPSNPSAHKDTVKLEQAGYDGFFHSDYDPRNSQKDADAIFVINPAKSVQLLRALEVPNKR